MVALPLCTFRRGRQGGVALLTALLLMLAVLMTGVAAARTAISGARAAGHERDRMLALQGAMAALADAEHDIEGGADPASSRAAAFADGGVGAFADGCRGGAPYEGLCSQAAGAEVLAALADVEGPGVTLGSFTGAHIPSGAGALPAQPPRYLIELMPSPPGALLYRITALGFGSAEATQVALQAYYRKLVAVGAPAGPGGPTGTADPGMSGAPGDADNPGESGQPGRPDVPAPQGEPVASDGAGDPAEAPGTLPAPADPSESAPPGAPGTVGGPGVRVGWREISNWHDALASSAPH